MAQPKVFVSHSRADDAFAKQLVKDLRGAGADVRLDKSDHGASDFHLISEALADCEWFLLVLTPSAITSPWVRQEVDTARLLRLQGRIQALILIQASAVDFDKVPLTWKVQGVVLNATGGYAAVHEQLLRMLRLTSPRPHHALFVSYRRDDSAGHAGRLHADLAHRYGASNVFMDLAIEPGEDFVTALDDAVSSCAVLLAVIGRYWLSATSATTGTRRLDDPNDFVRIEIATALQRDIRVIPVLVHGARMPTAENLPDVLKPLARRQAHEMTDSRWGFDLDKLTDVLDKVIGYSSK